MDFLCLLFVSLVVALPQKHMQTRASPGCGKPHLIKGITMPRLGLKSSGKDRSYMYHIPSSYDLNKPYPVVIGFHGSSSIGTFFELDTKMSEGRFSENKIMVYPNGIGGSWAGPSYHTGSTVEEDVKFVEDLIEDLKGSLCVDENKLYATGMSNGGGFIGTLACHPTASKVFAAFAAGSGAFYTDVNGPDNGCNPGRKPLPILEIHGGSDKTVKYVGGQGDGGPQPPIPSWLEWWAQRNECSDKTEETTNDGGVHHVSWSCGGVEAMLQHYKVDSMGHCWADTEPNLSQISVPQGTAPIQASRIVMDFFDRFPQS